MRDRRIDVERVPEHSVRLCADARTADDSDARILDEMNLR